VCADDEKLFAVVTDVDLNPKVPRFELDQIKELADLIEKKFL
jgi:hypothetical protein